MGLFFDGVLLSFFMSFLYLGESLCNGLCCGLLFCFFFVFCFYCLE